MLPVAFPTAVPTPPLAACWHIAYIIPVSSFKRVTNLMKFAGRAEEVSSDSFLVDKLILLLELGVMKYAAPRETPKKANAQPIFANVLLFICYPYSLFKL